jgi:hypothetical protein
MELPQELSTPPTTKSKRGQTANARTIAMHWRMPLERSR